MPLKVCPGHICTARWSCKSNVDRHIQALWNPAT